MNASEQGLAQIAVTTTDLHDYTVLIDLRDVKSRLSTPDIDELGPELAGYGDTIRRETAVLARADKDIHQATFFAHHFALNENMGAYDTCGHPAKEKFLKAVLTN